VQRTFFPLGFGLAKPMGVSRRMHAFASQSAASLVTTVSVPKIWGLGTDQQRSCTPCGETFSPIPGSNFVNKLDLGDSP
jgi:hypothetical protein